MSNQNNITELTFTKESDNWWHSRFTMDTDEVIVQIDSKTEREKYTLVVVYSGTEEYGTTYYNQSFALYGNSSRVFNIKGIEGLNIDIQTNIKPDFGGVMGSVTEVDPPTPPTPPDPPTPPEPPTPPTPTGGPMYFEAVQANSTVSIWSDLETAPNLEYSRDGATWQEWQYTTDYSVHTFNTITLSAVGDRVYLRGNNPDGLGFYDDEDEISYHSNFSLTGSIMAGGNIMSLLDKTMMMTEVPDYGFMSLFYKYNEPVPLLTPPDMSTITSIGYDGCYNMYQNCISLTTAANMPSLTTIGIGGCSHMYNNCTSLTTAADMSSLTTIGASGCDAMYEECTFDMSNDGTTLNFAFPTPPVIVGSNTYATAYDIAEWMGNTNGIYPTYTIRIDNSQSGQNIVIEHSDTQSAVQDGWVGNIYLKADEVLSFRPASIDDGGTTKYLAINGVVGTSYTVTTDTTLVITFE